MKRMVLMLCLGALTLGLAGNAWAGWVWQYHDEAQWFVAGTSGPNVQVKQDEYVWDSKEAGTDPFADITDGMWLYNYTVINQTNQLLTSFGFAENFAPGAIILDVRVTDGSANADFLPAANPNAGVTSPYWVAVDDNDPDSDAGLVASPPGDTGGGFQFISWQAPRHFYDAQVDNGGRIVASGKTSGPTPEPASAFLLLLGALPIAALRRRKS